MISGLGSALTALEAYRRKLGVTANNIANVNTDGFKKSRATTVENQHGGVRLNVSQVNTPGAPRIPWPPGSGPITERSNVDLTQELPDLLISQRSFEANLATIRTADDMLGELLDIKA